MKKQATAELKLTRFQNDIIQRAIMNFVNGGGYPHRNGNPYAKLAQMGLLKLDYATTTWSQYVLTDAGREYAIAQGWIVVDSSNDDYGDGDSGGNRSHKEVRSK